MGVGGGVKKRAEEEKGEDEGAWGEKKNRDENGAVVGGEEEEERGGEWVRRKEGRVPLILSDLGVFFLAEVGLCFPRLESEGPAGSPAALGLSSAAGLSW